MVEEVRSDSALLDRVGVGNALVEEYRAVVEETESVVLLAAVDPPINSTTVEADSTRIEFDLVPSATTRPVSLPSRDVVLPVRLSFARSDVVEGS